MKNLDTTLAQNALIAELAGTRTLPDFQQRVDLIAAAVRRAPDPETAQTALIIALASKEHAA